MLDAVAIVDAEPGTGFWPSRRVVAWSAILLNFSLWGAILSGTARLIGLS